MMASEIPATPVEAATAEDTAQAVEAQKQAAIVDALRTAEEQSAKDKAQAARREVEQARQARERAIAEQAHAQPEAVTQQTRGVMTEASELRAQAEATRMVEAGARCVRQDLDGYHLELDAEARQACGV